MGFVFSGGKCFGMRWWSGSEIVILEMLIVFVFL